MDKYEYKVKVEEIRDLIARGDYAQAADIADEIDWRRVKSTMTLCMISDLYKINKRLEDARNILELAYDKKPGAKNICYALCELCIRTRDYDNATDYYREFVQAAPKDSARLILEYKLYTAQEVSIEERIEVLQKLKQEDYRERWAYELAYLYHLIDQEDQCVEECDEMISWFGYGKYVYKAMELKSFYVPLSEAQQATYDNRFAEEESESEVVAQSESEESEYSSEETSESVSEETYESESTQESENDETDILVETIDIGQFSNDILQAELAEGLREVMEDSNSKITETILAPLLDGDDDTTKIISTTETTEISEGEEVIESTEVFFGETGEVSIAQITGRIPVPAGMAEFVSEEEPADNIADALKEQMRGELRGEAVQQSLFPEPPESLAKVLSQESDGQIRLVVPEAEVIEKQITGQLTISEYICEWERIRKEHEAKKQEQLQAEIESQTGPMFTEFEESIRDGLLEKLEKGEMDVSEVDGYVQDRLDDGEADEEALGEEFSDVVEDAETEDLEVAEEENTEETEDAVTEEEISDENETAEEAIVESIEEAAVEEVEETQEASVITEDVVETEEVAEELTDEESPEDNYISQSEYVFESENDYGEVEEIEEINEDPEPDVTQQIGYITGKIEFDKIGEELGETAEPDNTQATVDCVEDGEDSGIHYESLEATHDKAEKPASSRSERRSAPPSQPRERARALTKEEKELFTPFIQSRSDREKLVKAIDAISLASYTGNIIITGEEGMDTLTLAKNMVRELQMTDNNFSGKVAKVSGHGLGAKNIVETLETLSGGALIVLKASEMEDASIEELYKAIQRDNFGIVIIFEDTKNNMTRLLAEHPELKECFTARFDVQAMNNDALVAYGKQYARENEYSLDELGTLALHTKISELQTIDHTVTAMEVKEMVDAAIEHVNRKTPKHFFDILFAKRYDEEDMIILTEKDFI